MLYDSYHKKISKIVGTLRKIFKHIVLICIVSVLVLAAIIAFIATKGIVLDDKSISDKFEMTYGDDLQLNSKALFAEVSYEYSSDGEEWNNEKPFSVGTYYVRATAKALFGQIRYGKVYSFSINPKTIDVLVSDSEVVYGEMPNVSANLAFDDEIFCDNVFYSDLLTSYTNVTPDKNAVKIFNNAGENVTKSYKLNICTSAINILPRPISVTVSDKAFIYKDMMFSYDGYTLSDGSLVNGDVLQAVFDKQLIDVGSVLNTPQLRVVNSNGRDISFHYAISTHVGMLTVDYRPLVIQTLSAEKIYDDSELSNSEYRITGEYGIVNGHVAKPLSNTSILDVGEVENVIVLGITNQEGEDKTSNYSLFYERGTLKITPRPVNISSESATWVYDSKEHFTNISMSGFCDGHNVKASWPSIIDAGTIENTVTVSTITDSSGRDVLSNYEFIYDNIGTLTVTKRPITITHESSSFDYDGVERSFSQYRITSGSLAVDDELELVLPTFSQANTYDNKMLSATVNSYRADGVKIFDAQENYNITEVFGRIDIAKCKITLQAPEYTEKIYDGLPLTPSVDCEVVEGYLPLRHRIDVVYKSSGINVGEYDAEIDIEKTKIIYSGVDATSNFEITLRSGKLSILQRDITIRAGSAEKIYDGTPLTCNQIELIDGTLVDGDEIVEYRVDGSQIEVNSLPTPNRIDVSSIVIKNSNGEDVTMNYRLNIEDGTLKVRLRKLIVVSNSDSKIYDGFALFGTDVSVKELSEDNDGLADGHNLEYLLSNSIINVGTVENIISNLDIVDENGESVLAYYEIDFEYGILEILPIEINISTGSKSKIYDGTVLKYHDYTSDFAEKLVLRDTMTIDFTAQITNCDSVSNAVIVNIFDGNGINITDNGNYVIRYQLGTLTVTPRTIRVIPLPDRNIKLYDGTPLECNNQYELSSDMTSSEGLIRGDRLDECYFNSLTDAGVVDIEVTGYKITNSSGADVSGNYEVVADGNQTFTIMPRKIVIQSSSARKKYDGRPLISNECSWSNESEDMLLDGHVIDLEAHGSQTDEGISNNVIITNAIICDRSGHDVTNNYEITYKEGTLEVYKIVVATVTSDKNGTVYLKTKSYGNYNGRGFDEPPREPTYFHYLGYSCSYMLWSSTVLENSGYWSNNLNFTNVQKYMLPYYMALDGVYDMPLYYEDYSLISNDSSYTVPYYDYSFERDGTQNLMMDIDMPSSYIDWVEDNYLAIQPATRRALLNLVASHGFANLDNESKIKEVAKYIRIKAEHNDNYDVMLDSESDVAVAFLTNYLDGSAKHHAIAATMLYRALGIPARYVEGYIADVFATDATDVKDAHAWVEVFLYDYGWVYIDVTKGDDELMDITVKPKDIIREYNGEILEATESELFRAEEYVFDLFDNGYRIISTFSGSRVDVGEANSYIDTIRILDENGNDVTYKFNISTMPGKLVVTPIAIEVFLYNISKTYDGNEIRYTNSKFYSIRDTEFKNSGYILDLSVHFPEVDVHKLTAAEMNENIDAYISYSVMDGITNISQNYTIRIVTYSNDISPDEYVVAEIKPRSIEITSVSQTKYYVDGAKLINGTVNVTKGSLLSGHILNATGTGVLDKVGSVENTINPEYVSIFDAAGNPITQNYKISIVNGTLTFIE